MYDPRLRFRTTPVLASMLQAGAALTLVIHTPLQYVDRIPAVGWLCGGDGFGRGIAVLITSATRTNSCVEVATSCMHAGTN